MKSQTAATKPLRHITAGELLDETFPAREYAVRPWLRTEESAMIWAPTGVGKTWLTLSLAVAMAGGGRVWEWNCPKPRRVLLIDGEMNTQDLQSRIKTLVENGCVEDIDMEALRDNLLLAPRQYQKPKTDFYDITRENSQKTILDDMRKVGAEVLIVDNLTTCADDLDDENDATAFRSTMDFFLMMKQAKKTVLVVHHANKGGASPRGSTAFEATFEVMLGLKKPEVSRTDVASFIADFGKIRTKGDDSVAKPHLWTLTETGWEVYEDEDAKVHRLLEALRTRDYVNQTELGKALGINQSNVSRTLTRAVLTNHITRDEIDNLFIQARQIRKGEDLEGFDSDLDDDDDDDEF